MLEQKALEDFNHMHPLLNSPNHQRCRNIRTSFSMATQFTHWLYWLYLRAENRINSKRYEISPNFIFFKIEFCIYKTGYIYFLEKC